MTPFKRLIRYLRKYRAKILVVLLVNILYAFFSIFTLSMIVPFLSVLFDQVQQVVVRPSFSLTSRFFIDTFYYYMGLVVIRYGKLASLGYIALVMVGLSLLSNLFRYLGMYFLAPIRSGILKDLRHDMYNHLLILPLSFYSRQRKGDIISRIGADVLEVEWSVFTALQSLCRDPVMILVFLVTLFSINVKLTLVSLVILPIVGILLGNIGRRIRQYSLRSQQLLGEMSSLYEEAVGGLRVIKGYNAQAHTYENFKYNNFKFRKLSKKVFRISELGSPLVEFLCIFALLLITIIGFLWVPKLALGNGSLFMLFFIVFARIIVPAKSLVTSFYTMQKGLTAAARVYEIIDAPDRIAECEDPLPLCSFQEGIEYRDVSFSYRNVADADACEVLHRLNFTLRKGQTMAIVGPSGSGKSTLVDLLPRFYDVTFGQILLDGEPLQRYALADLRQLFGIVSQDVILFHDTVYNNIVFGMPHVTEEQVVAAAKIAQAHDFIMEMEEGYRTVIGDRGMRLSGGQRQRLSIARALLREPQILILDEATSALDSESEYLFQEALMPYARQHTSIIIAHRLSTIRHADIILFLKEGQIVERGTHETLMNLKGEYYRFCSLQQ